MEDLPLFLASGAAVVGLLFLQAGAEAVVVLHPSQAVEAEEVVPHPFLVAGVVVVALLPSQAVEAEEVAPHPFRVAGVVVAALRPFLEAGEGEAVHHLNLEAMECLTTSLLNNETISNLKRNEILMLKLV